MNAKPANKPVIAVVGGIGSGKSEVAKLFARSGGMLFNADAEVRDLFKDEGVKKKIRDYFGATVFDSAGNIERPALAKVVFGNAESRLFLESILHPLILKKVQQKIQDLANFSESSFLVLDIPLILEKNWRNLCSLLVFVNCSRDVRLRRCMARGWTEAEWESRENSQMPLTDKAAICDHIIDNSGSYDYTLKQVDDLLKLWNLP
jgi:dephospho-CoA kinase